MGSFSILRKPTEGAFDVDECHINFWSLPGFFGRRIYFFDVGIIFSVSAEDSTVNRIHLALPFRSNGNQSEWKDLGARLEGETGQLIFGRASSAEKHLIKFDGVLETQISSMENDSIQRVERPPIRVIQITEANRSQNANEPAHWSLDLAKSVSKANTCDAGEKMYIRVRFVTRDPERLWTWNSGNVALADFRIGDTREILARDSVDALNILEDWFVPIKKIRIFLILPSYLLYRASRPELHHMRLFEGDIWKKYLGRSVNLLKKEKYMIYQWRNGDDENIKIIDSKTNDFKAFMVLSKQEYHSNLANIVITSLLVSIFVYFLLSPDALTKLLTYLADTTLYKSFLSKISTYLTELFGSWGYAGALLIIIYILFKNLLRLPKVSQAYMTIKNLLYAVEDWVYGVRTKIP